MAKKAPEKKSLEKKSVDKKSFDNKSFKQSLGLGSQVVKEKELSWIPFKEAFHEAVGVPVYLEVIPHNLEVSQMLVNQQGYMNH